MNLLGRFLSKKTPRLGRCFALVALFTLMSTPGFAQSPSPEESVSASEAVRAALTRPEAELALESRLNASKSRVDEQTRVHPPTLSLGYERVFGDSERAASEFTAMVEQEIDVTRWRSRLRQSLSHQEDAQRAEYARWRLETAHRVRHAFYAVRYHEERLAQIDVWRGHLEEALEATRAREARGDVSAYMSGRIARELKLAAAREAMERAELASAWADLQSRVGWGERPRLRGELLPVQHVAPEGLATPQQQMLQASIQALGAELDASSSPLLRGWTLGVGYRQDRAGALAGHGVMVGLSLPLAFWNPDAPRQARLRAEQAALSHDLELLNADYEREMQAANARLRVAERALEANTASEADDTLIRQARQAFDAGEASLAELLDVYESELELQLVRLGLQWDARRADLNLQRLQGLGVSK